MFKEGSIWRENQLHYKASQTEYRFGIQDMVFDQPQGVSDQTVLEYFIRVYRNNIETDKSDSSLFFKIDNVLEFLHQCRKTAAQNKMKKATLEKKSV